MNDNRVRPEPTTNTTQPLAVLPSAPQNDSHNKEGLKSIIGTIAILLMAPIIALAITAFVFQSYEVDGPSMETTLQDKDRLVVWKLGHTLSRISGKPYIPERGSIIVFVKKGMTDFTSGKDKQLIKRVLALPGERVFIKDGVITVYNNEHPNGFNPDKTLGIESMISGTATDDYLDTIVEDDHVFAVGDHRNNSLDSRAFGAIPSKDIIGTLTARILPLAEAKKF